MNRKRTSRSYSKSGGKRPLVWIAALLAVVLLAGLAWFLWPSEPDNSGMNDTSNRSAPPVNEPEPDPLPLLVNLQPVVDEWLSGQSADFGIVVYDPAHQQPIAAHQPNKQYFAASLYKIFIAYLALEDFQTGAQDPNAILTGGFTRKECVDKMIRESHSPCGEAMMASMGPARVQERLVAMNIKSTTFPGITTTAHDSATILRYILDKRDLNAENTAFLKDAMRIQDQRYRNGLAKGAPEATWETKVGWNQQYNYHDIGIMTLPNGREYIVAILSQNNGSPTPIANFATTIYETLVSE